ncbi:MAG: hypothetical protein JWS10_826 [Cypionkella sp.]|uniref:DUF4268 domain-containing protein n=1 Tax=Cypionkella sp. TaxID=2811411 RepID=UPI00260179CA|nr:DUF4268 domain-containing protein [Cypionkella sp.]MDB5658211.1 hypothetical protein [Cypionkella sp.]
MADINALSSTEFPDFWRAFSTKLGLKTNATPPFLPTKKNWIGFPIGSPGSFIHIAVISREEKFRVGLTLQNPMATEWFLELKRSRFEIEREFGETLCWDEKPLVQRCAVTCSVSAPALTDRKNWDAAFEWAAPRIVRLE